MFTANPQQIDFRGKQAHAWHYLNDQKTSEIFYGGAAGGGKSFLGCIWHITNRIRYPESRGLIGRAKISNLEQSTLVTLFKVASHLGYIQGIDFTYNSQKHVINWINGSQTILKDLFLYPSDPDFISLGSTEYTDAFIDEGTEVTQKAFDIVNSRIRWKLPEYGLIPKILVTCNPSPGWVKDNYVMDVHNQPIKLKDYQKFVFALVDDNPDKTFVSIYKQQLNRMFSEYDKARLLFGDWDAEPEISNPFAIQYDSEFHESEVARHYPDKQLYISVDFNLNPFAVTFWHFWQDQNIFYFYGFDEAEIQQGSIPAMIDLIKQRYGKHLHTAILTGDAMGKQGQISQRDNSSHYQSMKRELNLANSQIQVPANPTHVNSRDDVNRILFESKKPGARVKFFLSPSRMPNTCRDFRVVQCDAFGSIVKGKRTDLNQRADYLDCFVGDTAVMTSAGNKPIDKIIAGEIVYTRNGLRKVLDTWSSMAQVYEFTLSDGTKIQCTKDHKFYAHNVGWIGIYDIFERKYTVCKNQSFTTEDHTESIPNKITTTSVEKATSTPDHYIGKYGSIIMVKFLQAWTFITKMKTRTITMFQTLNLYPGRNTKECTSEKDCRHTPNTSKHSKLQELRPHQHGTKALQESNGINKTQRIADSGSRLIQKETAITAVSNTHQKHLFQGSVTTTASRHGGEKTIPTRLKWSVRNAKLNLRRLNIYEQNTAVKPADLLQTHTGVTVNQVRYVGYKQVYDITVDQEHEFYANGVLVHNCARYFLNLTGKPVILKYLR